MRRRAALVVLVSAVSAGCGGGGGDNALDPVLAEELASQSVVLARSVQRHTRCETIREGTQALQQRAIDATNAGDVPANLQEPLQSELNEITDAARKCSPKLPDRLLQFASWVRARAEKS